jgi:hypothetical protein
VLYNRQAFLTAHVSRRPVPRQLVCHLDWVEDMLAVPEDLVDFLEMEVVGLREEQVNTWEQGKCLANSGVRFRNVHGRIMRKFVHANTM